MMQEKGKRGKETGPRTAWLTSPVLSSSGSGRVEGRDQDPQESTRPSSENKAWENSDSDNNFCPPTRLTLGLAIILTG